MSEKPTNGSTDDRGVCATDAEATTAQPLAPQQDSAAAESLTAHILPTGAPLQADGNKTAPDRTAPEPPPTCKCGALQHPTNMQICAKGHAWAGNQRTRVNPLGALDEGADDEPLDHVEMVQDALKLLRREYKKLRRHLRLNLTTTARRAARKDLRALAQEVLAHAQFLEGIASSHQRATGLMSVFARLSPESVAVVLKDLGAARLEDVAAYDGPLPLRVEFTDVPHEHECCPLQYSSSAAPSSGQPDAIARKWVDPDVTFTPQPPKPILAVSNDRPKEPAIVTAAREAFAAAWGSVPGGAIEVTSSEPDDEQPRGPALP